MSEQDPTVSEPSEVSDVESSEDDLEEETQAQTAPDRVDLPHADGLLGHETNKIAGRYPTKLIVVDGQIESGKTTLITSLYESFRSGPFGGLCLGESRTLVGLEKICHRNRLESGRREPDTTRTRPEDIRYYHFALVPVECSSGDDRQDFLIVAPSGESFLAACDSTEECQSLTFLKRADLLLILLDGAKLSQRATRQNELSFASLVLRSILDAEMLSSYASVEFVISKLDCIRQAGDDAAGFVEHAQRELYATFKGRIHCTFREIASRPTSPGLSFAYNLDAAVQSWRGIDASATEGVRLSGVGGASTREFHLFASRYRQGNGGLA